MDSVRELLTEDHSRLGLLLEDAGNCDSAGKLASYDKFRRGLLKHIGIEEKILLPTAARLRGAALEQAARLRLDHGALVALLMPVPTAAIVRAIKSVLAAHNPIEEGADGVYQICQTLATAETDELVRKIRAASEVPTTPNTTSTRIIDAAKRALVRAGYDAALLDDEVIAHRGQGELGTSVTGNNPKPR